MKKINILIADDHPIVRAGFKQVIADTEDMVVADEAENGQDVLSFIQKKDYDIILLDISMPGRNGLEILKDLKADKPKTPVLILSIYPEEQYAIRALRAGASGSMTKAGAPLTHCRHLQDLSGRQIHQRFSCGEAYRLSRYGLDKTAP